MSKTQTSPSPRWGSLTKLVIALTVIVIAGALLVRFQSVVVPVLMAFMVSYLLHPLAAWIDRKTPLSWRMTVNIIYLIFIILLVALLTVGGVGLVQQVQNLINTIQKNINELPAFIDNLSSKVYQIGPFTLDFTRFDWTSIGQQVLGYVQPALGQLGGLVGTLASSAASTVGWLAFIVLVSYFFLAESGGLRSRIIQFEIPGYAEDMRHLGQELGRIWNAYLRGQLIIFFSTVIIYTIVLTILGVRYAFGLALIAGFANFLPYIGPAINWIVLGLVTYFQGSTIFGINPLAYTGIVLVISVIIDQVFSSLVAPRIMAQKLNVHPAFVLIAAIIAASLLGVVGVILAAPLLATLQLFGTYILRKMLDRDPWPEEEARPPAERKPRWWRRFLRWWRSLRKKTA
jgi:predicted PurR-regulated permease PerM